MAFKRHLYNDIVYIMRLCNQVKRWKFHRVIPPSLNLGSWIWSLSHLEWHNKRIGVMVRIRYLHSIDKMLLDSNNLGHHHLQFSSSSLSGLFQTFFFVHLKKIPSLAATRGQPNILISSICDLRGISMCNMVCWRVSRAWEELPQVWEFQ